MPNTKKSFGLCIQSKPTCVRILIKTFRYQKDWIQSVFSCLFAMTLKMWKSSIKHSKNVQKSWTKTSLLFWDWRWLTKDKFFLMFYWIEKKYIISILPFTATPAFPLSDLMQYIWQKNIYIYLHLNATFKNQNSE